MDHTLYVSTPEVLEELITKHNKLYRLGTPEISDEVYDALVATLKEMCPDHAWFNAIEPAPVVNPGRKRKLPIPMRSLNKIKSIVELQQWIKSLSLGPKAQVVCMPKFDGGSLLYDEITHQAYSRGGDENEGQDCTNHIHSTKCLSDKYKSVYTFGEFLFSYEKWNNCFKGKISPYSGEPYKSPRNTACGLLNRDIPGEEIQHAQFFRYGVDQGSLGLFNSFHHLISDMCSHFNQPHLYVQCAAQDLTEEYLQGLYCSWEAMYPIDGIVVYVDDLKIWEKIGRHQTSGNPLYAIAYKHPEFTQHYSTKVLGVEWKISKSGAFKPVVCVEPVDTGDCIMENPTGYNAGWINDYEIAEGAEVVVTRSGGVIPKIVRVASQATSGAQEAMWDGLAACPSCGRTTAWKSAELYCTNLHCHDRLLAETVFFYQTCGAEDLGEETLKKIHDAGWERKELIVHMSFDDLIKIDGVGEHMANVIVGINKRILQGVDLPTLMHASNCFSNIGKSKAEKIINQTLNESEREDLYNLQMVPNWSYSGKTMEAFNEGLTQFYSFVQAARIPVLKPTKIKQISSRFVGKTACFSGVRDKSLEAKFVEHGGKIVNSVSKNLDFLVVKSKADSSSKISKANLLKVNIVELVDFTNML